MNKRKKIIIIITILSSIILAFIGGQSFSKYVSQVKGYGTAEIATWNFKVNGTTEQIQNIDLASTSNNATLLGNKLAPGTEGSFDITVDGTGSDVGINYNINFEGESPKPQNLIFIYDNKQYHYISELGKVLSGTINADDENKNKIFTIKWEWPYETGDNQETKISNDIVDTQDVQNISNYSFNIIVSGTQVEPQA